MRPITAAVAAFLLVLTGCTGITSTDVESDPEDALRGAVEAVGDYDGIELTLSATGDAAALADDPDDERTAQLVLDSRIVIIAAGESEEDVQVELRVDLDGNDVFELRVLPGSQVFLRADPEGFAEAVDDPTITDDLDGLVDAARELGFGDVAEVALSGGWIELTGVEQLQEFAEGFGGPMGAEEEPSEEDIERLQEQVVGAFERFVDEDVSVAYVGSDDAGERVRATATGAALQRLLTEITGIAAEAGGVDPNLLGDLDVDGDLPDDASFTLDVWIDGGELSQVGVDLAELDDAGEIPGDTFLLVGIAEFTGQVEAPADAEPFDLFGLISGFLFGGMGGPGGMDLEGGIDDLDGLEDPPAAPGEDELDDLGEFDEAEIECVPQDEVDEFELQELVDAGFLEVC